ncbi:MAG TPA: hypothetical protein VIO62_04185 [Candidatus Dormibacteraeota bacterium]|jgi:photosystem II stability/assembly factor-like uncharacterized protein
MKPSARSAIRNDVLAEYEMPDPRLTTRVLRAIPEVAGRPAPHRRRVALQTVGVLMAAVVIVVTTIGVRVSRGEMALPAGLPFGVGGLHPPAASYSIVDAQYVSADTAWIVAQLHVHNGPIVVMNTIDGGKTWREQFRIPDGSSIDNLHFWTARDGELTELVPSTLPPSKTPGAPGSSNMVQRLYRTQDGGRSWQLVDRPVDWEAVGASSFFLSEMEGWRIPPTLHGASPGAVQHTVDGGGTWVTVGPLPVGAWLGSLTFTNSQTGWIAASESKSYAWDATGKPIPYTPPVALLWVTRDGGHTWTAVDLPLPTEAAANNVGLESPVFFGSRDGLLEFEVTGPPPTLRPDTSQLPPAQGWTHSYILATHDGGQRWANLVQPPGGLQQGGALFFDARHWLLSRGPSISETLNAGKTWTTRQVLANGLDFSFAPWNFIDAKTIWSQVGANMLVRSTDGGTHWSAVTPPTIR